MPERRRLKRHRSRIPAAFASGTLHGRGHVKNVSREGLFLRTERLPRPGDPVRILLAPQRGEKLELLGIVRWTTDQLPEAERAKPGFGMHLDPVTEAFLDFYEQILLG